VNLFTDTLGHIGYLDYVLSIKNDPKSNTTLLAARPIPAANELNYTLETQGEPLTLSLYSMAGNEVYTQTNAATSGIIPVSQLANGIYILRAQSATHQSTMKIAVQH
jgi:hypothetical protein